MPRSSNNEMVRGPIKPKRFIFPFLLALTWLGAAQPVIAGSSYVDPSPTPATEILNGEEVVSSPEDKVVDRPDFDPGSPYYLHVPSRWAIGFRFALSKIPVPGALGNTFQFFGEYMIPFWSFGYVSGGIHVGSFPLQLPSADVPYPNYGNSVMGAQARYQLKFSKAPLLVPIVGFEWEFYKIKESSTNDNVLSGFDFGLSAGVMLNMGFIDRATEQDAHDSIGLTRAYATFELRAANLNNTLFSLAGNYWLFGIRLELK
ncbi:MAG: hypothetical protein JST80_02665 [Bdellovibrionales bacterium]|nr:hypothetical protein [Bdellovibrionales bacterium]